MLLNCIVYQKDVIGFISWVFKTCQKKLFHDCNIEGPCHQPVVAEKSDSKGTSLLPIKESCFTQFTVIPQLAWLSKV